MCETTRKHFVPLLVLPGILGSLMTQSALADNPAAAQRPNIVYFMIDELGYYELSLTGHPEFRTPNIDRPGDFRREHILTELAAFERLADSVQKVVDAEEDGPRDGD